MSVKKDFRRTFENAKRGDATAQSILGYWYLKGLAGPRNYAKARLWLRKAAAQGQTEAITNLGLMFQLGDGEGRTTDKPFTGSTRLLGWAIPWPK